MKFLFFNFFLIMLSACQNPLGQQNVLDENFHPGVTFSYTASTIEVSNPTVVSGTNVTVTFTAKDDTGAKVPVSGLSVTFSLRNGTSTGSFSSVIDHGDGTYSSLFKGIIPGNPTEIMARVGGVPITSSSPLIQVNDVAPSSLGYSSTSSIYTIGSPILNNMPSAVGYITHYSITPTLPAGLSLDPSTGIISGIPLTVSSAHSYTVTGMNSSGSTDTIISITVNDVVPSSLSYSTNIAIYTINSPIADNIPSSSGGSVVTYSVSPLLPTGMSLDTSTGIISGTPTTLQSTANYTVTATNSGGSTTKIISITVIDVPPSSLSYSDNSPTYTKNSAISDNIPSSSGGPVVTYSISPSLPTGLNFNTSTGVISGTSSVFQTSTDYIVTATNTGGSATKTLSITINDEAPTSISYGGSPFNFLRNTSVGTISPSTTGGGITGCSSSPTLPSGLSLSSSCVITGSASALSSSTNYTITGSNVTGSVDTTISVAVGPRAVSQLTITGPSTLNTGYCSSVYTVESQSADGDANYVASNTTINFSASNDGPLFYSDSSCTTQVTSLVLGTSSTQQTVYMKTNIAGVYTLTAAATGLTSVTTSTTVSSILSRIDLFSGIADNTGYLDATGSSALFNGAQSVTSDGTYTYVADTLNSVIRKINISTGVTTTLAGQEGSVTSNTGSLLDDTTSGANAKFNSPSGIVYDSGYLYVADSGNSAIRRVDPTTGATITLAGSYPTPTNGSNNNATGTSAKFKNPKGLTVLGGFLYIVDTGNHRIRKMSLTAPYAVTAVAGSSNGYTDSATPGSAQFSGPYGITNDGTSLYVTDSNNSVIRKIDLSAGSAVTTIAGSGVSGYSNDPIGTNATFDTIRHLIFNNYLGSALYIADNGNYRIRKIELSGTFPVTSFSGGSGANDNVPVANAKYNGIAGMGQAALNSPQFFVSETNANRIRKVSLDVDNVIAIAGAYHTKGNIAGTASDSRYNAIRSLVKVGSDVYLVASNILKKMSLIDGSTINLNSGSAGFANGPLSSSFFSAPGALLYDGGDKLYIADTNNHCIREVTFSTSTVATFAGQCTNQGNVNGTRLTAKLKSPSGLAFNSDKSKMYFSEESLSQIRVIDMASGVISNFAGTGSVGNTDGTGTAAAFNGPRALVSDGTYLYLTDGDNHNIRKIEMSSAIVITLAGPITTAGSYGAADGTGSSALFYNPYSITYDGSQYLYVADFRNGAIRKIDKDTGQVTTMAGALAKPNDVNGVLSGTTRVIDPYSIIFTDSGIFIGQESNVRWIH